MNRSTYLALKSLIETKTDTITYQVTDSDIDIDEATGRAVIDIDMFDITTDAFILERVCLYFDGSTLPQIDQIIVSGGNVAIMALSADITIVNAGKVIVNGENILFIKHVLDISSSRSLEVGYIRGGLVLIDGVGDLVMNSVHACRIKNASIVNLKHTCNTTVSNAVFAAVSDSSVLIHHCPAIRAVNAFVSCLDSVVHSAVDSVIKGDPIMLSA